MGKKSGGDKNYISVWQWLLLFLLFALPCIGLGILLALAFVGENESRKNYCRAILLWSLFVFLLWFVLMTLGFWPVISQHLQLWLHQIQQRLAIHR